MNKFTAYLHTADFAGVEKLCLSLSLGLLITITMTGLVSFAADCDEVRQDVLRLHILANSDSETDQNLKLKVRDRVLLEARGIFEGETNRDEAKAIASENLQELIAAAQDEVYKAGRRDIVNAEITNMYFETREYAGFTLPAGRYEALRFTIGKGEGHNWWCVMFPPMCIPVSLDEEPDLSLFTQSELKLVQRKPRYEPRFAVVELIEKLKNLS